MASPQHADLDLWLRSHGRTTCDDAVREAFVAGWNLGHDAAKNPNGPSCRACGNELGQRHSGGCHLRAISGIVLPSDCET